MTTPSDIAPQRKGPGRGKVRMVKFGGRIIPLRQACSEAGLSYTMVQGRLRIGWSEFAALNTKAGRRR